MTMTKSRELNSLFHHEDDNEYWFKSLDEPWKPVSKEKYIKGENNAGFFPKGGGSGLATESFSNTQTNTKGMITSKTNTPEQYEWDPELATVMRAYHIHKK